MEHHPIYQKVTGSILSQGTYLDCRFNPWLGHMWGATDRSFSLTLMFVSLFLAFSLKSINISLSKDFKK